MKAMRRLLIEAGPLAAFFIANTRYDIYVATAVFMSVVAVSLAASWLLERRLPSLPLVTAVFVLIFGGLTLYLHDETFIKLKPTIVNGLFGVILLGGLVFRRALLKPLLDYSFQLTDEGWAKLTLRWGLFFVLLAVLNEAVWRSVSTDDWVSFKVFVVMPLTLVFALLQVRFLLRHQLLDERKGGP